MAHDDTYIDLGSREISLAKLDKEERRLVTLLRRRAATHPDWTDFDNFWMRTVAEFYDGRGVPRKESSGTTVFRVAQDLSSRLAVASATARLPDYRDELEELIRARFRTRRAFCKATGVSEDMLSHVLAGRKDLSMHTLSRALERIGYRLQITPVPRKRRTA